MSELLACDWNATRLAVDDGVDIFAVKGQETRTVQVKTAHASQAASTRFQFQIDLLGHQKYLGVRHYYVLVLRRREPLRWTNDFIILSSNELDELRHKGLLQVGQAEKLSLVVKVVGHRYLVNGEEDVTDKTNDFQSRFR